MLLKKDEYLELESMFIQIREQQKKLKSINTQMYDKVESLYHISIDEIINEAYSNNNNFQFINDRLMIVNMLRNIDDEGFNFELFEQYIMAFKNSK